jgi:hypothetical protein
MAKIINLRTARKQATRDNQREKAHENAARHGRSASERALEKARADKARADLDAHKREP